MLPPLHRFFPALFLVGTLGLTVAPSPAYAQGDGTTRKAAATRFNRGIELYEEGDYAASLVEFRRAYDLSPNYRVLYNIALAQYQVGDYAGALASLEQYLEDAGDEIGADKRANVKKELAKMRDRVGTIAVEVAEDGATITIDGQEVGTTPLDGPIRVSIGQREVVVTKDGRQASKRVDIATGDDLRVELTLPEARGDGDLGPPAPVPGSADDTEANYVPAGVLWAFAGAGAVGTIITGTLALGASNELEDLRGEVGSTQADREAKQTEMTRLGVVTDVLWVTSAVLGVMALTFTIVPPDADDETEDEADDVGLESLDLRASPVGVSLQGSF